MKTTASRIQHFAFLAGTMFGAANCSSAATINASSCSQSSVSAAISSAAIGDVVQIPPGSCSWSALSITKAIQLKGAGAGQTNITLAAPGLNITKQSNGIIRISQFSFGKSGGGQGSSGINISGAWKTAQPVIFQDNDFNVTSTSGLFSIAVPGGVIIAKNRITAGYLDYLFQAKNPQDQGGSWSSADSMGTKDANGTWNIYIEGNTIYGGTSGIDCDDACRAVYRYNDVLYSAFNSHGFDTSNPGMRHFEIYNNTFRYAAGSSDIANNPNGYIWLRGGTGVIFNNSMQNIQSQAWGNPPEIKLSIRGAEDARPQGSCANTRYPVPHQLGQGHNGTSTFRDPIYIWNNAGTVGMGEGWNWGNPCGLSWSTFFQWGRDAVQGSAKPGYEPYPYPHPLTQAGSATQPLNAPTGLRLVP